VVSGFDPLQSYTWNLFTTSQAVLGFDANDFTINSTSFTNNNPIPGGSFAVGLSDDGTDVVLRYTAVPEPSSLVLLVTGLGISVMARRRRQS
jgi:hypothetical protein